MAYNLPPAWDGGWALPENVKDEGLERRGFVTKQMPRGTYDQPKVGTGGYAVPQYVMDEGYGQGTFTTKWAPRGRYDLPVPNWLDQRSRVLKQKSFPGGNVIEFAALSGTEFPALYTKFGVKSARAICARVAALPAAQRKAALKQILDRIDPTLYARTAQIGSSQSLPLEAALARAMSSGIAAEIVTAGARRAAPQPRSLLGLGQMSSLGAWDASAIQQLASGGATRATLQVAPRLQVGPFIFPSVDGKTTTIAPTDIGADAYNQLAKEIAKRSGYLGAAGMSSVGYVKNASDYGLGWGVDYWATGQPGTAKPGGKHVHELVVTGKQPMYYFEMPAVIGIPGWSIPATKRFGIYARFVGTAAAPKWEISWRENEPDAITRAFSSLTKLVAKIIDLAKDAIELVGDLACAVATSPGGQQAGATAGVASGAGAAAGQAGAAIAANVCGKGGGGGAGPPIVTATSSNILPLAIAGGVALVAIAAFGRKKKKAATP